MPGPVSLTLACVDARDAGPTHAGVDAGVIDAGPAEEDAGVEVDGGTNFVDAGTPLPADAGRDESPMPVG